MADWDPDTLLVRTLTNAELQSENSDGTAILSRRFTAHLHLGMKMACGSVQGWMILGDHWDLAFQNLAKHTPHTIPQGKIPHPSGPGVLATRFGNTRKDSVFWVGTSTGTGLARLTMPSFVAAVCRLVECSERELVVAPISANGFLATNCSEVAATYMLGLSRLKYESSDCSISVPPMQLAESAFPLRLDGKPGDHILAWQDYIAFGSRTALVMDGNLLLHGPVPPTQAQVQKVSKGVKIEECFPSDFCTLCNKRAPDMKTCGGCFVARYCSEAGLGGQAQGALQAVAGKGSGCGTYKGAAARRAPQPSGAED